MLLPSLVGVWAFSAESLSLHAEGVVAGGAEFWRVPLNPAYTIWLDDDYTATACIFLAVAGLRLMKHHARLVLWAAASALVCSAITAAQGPLMSPHELELASARYQTLGVVPFCVLAGAGLVNVWRDARGLSSRAGRILVPAVLLLALVVTSVAPFVKVTTPRTIDLEYGFLRDELPSLAPGTEVLVLYTRGGESGLKPCCGPETMPAGMGCRVWPDWPKDLKSTDRNLVFYRGAVCDLDPLRYGRAAGTELDPLEPQAFEDRKKMMKEVLDISSLCDEMVAKAHESGRVIAERELPLRRFAYDYYVGGKTRVGLHQLNGGGR